MIKKILIGGLLLVVLIVGGAYAYRNVIVEGAVEEGSSYALGVETDLGSASLNIGGGALALDGLEVENPDGFTSDYFFRIEEGLVAVNTGSVFDDEIVIDTFRLRGISLNLEQVDGSGNFSQILGHIKSVAGETPSESDTKLKIGYLAIEDIAVSATVSALGEKRFEKEYAVDGFTVTNLGEQSLTIAEVSGIIFEKLITRAVSEGGSLGFDPSATFESAKENVAEKVKTEVSSQLKKLGIGGK